MTFYSAIHNFYRTLQEYLRNVWRSSVCVEYIVNHLAYYSEWILELYVTYITHSIHQHTKNGVYTKMICRHGRPYVYQQCEMPNRICMYTKMPHTNSPVSRVTLISSRSLAFQDRMRRIWAERKLNAPYESVHNLFVTNAYLLPCATFALRACIQNYADEERIHSRAPEQYCSRIRIVCGGAMRSIGNVKFVCYSVGVSALPNTTNVI